MMNIDRVPYECQYIMMVLNKILNQGNLRGKYVILRYLRN